MTTADAPNAPTSPLWVRAIPRVIGLWILAGALFKLLKGSPAHLPEIVTDLSPWGKTLTYQLVIAVELVLVVLAFFRPRWAWLWLAGCLATFCAILLSQILAGNTNCGCFGASSPPPALMLAIDATLLIALLVSKPWANLPVRGANPIAIIVLSIAGILLPFLYDREVDLSDLTDKTGTQTKTEEVANTSSESQNGGTPEATTPDEGDNQSETRQFLVLDVDKMVGQKIEDTVFAKFFDPYLLPADGLWVIYRHTCEHCEEHLQDMLIHEQGDRMLGMIRLIEPQDTDQNRVVFAMPVGGHVLHAEMPATYDYVIQTPSELLIEGGIVKAAKEGVDPGAGL